MFELIVAVVLMLQTVRLYRGFPQYEVIFVELVQSTRIRYLVFLLPAAPMIVWVGSFYFCFVPALILAVAGAALTWFVAHAQYHFFDANSSVPTDGAQNWLSRVEVLAILTSIYLILHLLCVVFAHVLTA